MDCASSGFYKDGKYHLEAEGRSYTNAEFAEYLESLVNGFPIISIEDGMDENDWEGWKLLTEKLGGKVQLVGDDLFVTNRKSLPKALKRRIKRTIGQSQPNRYLSETLKAVDLANRNRYASVMSHRSGETEDGTIADLAVATNCMQIKAAFFKPFSISWLKILPSAAYRGRVGGSRRLPSRCPILPTGQIRIVMV